MTDSPISVDSHLELALKNVFELGPYEQPLLECMGLPVVGEINSPVSLPVFDNSSMDGYAVRFADVATATSEHPVQLPVAGEIAAGKTTIHQLEPGTAVLIMTGAPIPAGSDTVIPFEATDSGNAKVTINEAPTLGQYIRRVGEDIKAGAQLVGDGQRINARTVGLLAAVGIGRVLTRPRPRVVILSTGSELVEPGQAITGDQIYDGNSYMLAAAAKNLGAIAYRVQAAPDNPQAFLDILSDQLVRADLVVTSGGVSKGTHDVVKEALINSGTVRFHEVAMQPGKPQGFGTIGDDDTPIYALPGNPVSAYISFELFVAPAIRKMIGISPVSKPRIRAKLTRDVTSLPGRRQYLRGRFEIKVGAPSTVTPVGGPASHLVHGLAQSNALIVLAEDNTAAPAGSDVPVILLDTEY